MTVLIMTAAVIVASLTENSRLGHHIRNLLIQWASYVLWYCIIIIHWSLSCSYGENDSSVSMAIVLKEHFDSTIHHNLDDVNRVTIRHKHIWRDTIRTMSHPTFDLCKCVPVTFIGEEAVDGGIY